MDEFPKWRCKAVDGVDVFTLRECGYVTFVYVLTNDIIVSKMMRAVVRRSVRNVIVLDSFTP